ncbi:MAG TPA: hypothetical protein VIV12_02560 [Streptosporangiaceae bacterium]
MEPVAGAPRQRADDRYTIFTTGEDIRVAKDDPDVTGKVGWLPPPEVGEMAYFMVAFARPTGQQIHMRNAVPVAGFAMKTGEALLVTATRRAINPRRRSSCASSAKGLHTCDRRLWRRCRTPRSPGR